MESPEAWSIASDTAVRCRIRGILFDSGDTLVRPIGGEWWPGSRFREVLEAYRIRDLQWHRLEYALQEGMRYLNDHHHLMTEDEEREQFQTYYSVLLKALGVACPDGNLTYKLASVLVDGIEIEPFPDTHRVLGRLRERGLLLGIVSNAWPSLERKYRLLGLRGYFDTFVISAQVGCCKPDERIFRRAIEGLGLPLESVLFVDDSPRYVKEAIALGLDGVVMARSGQPPTGSVRWVSSLEEIEALLW